MTYLNPTHSTAGTSLAARFSALRQSIATSLRKNRAYSTTRAQLEAMTDRDLADIGITRFMIDDIAAQAAAQA